MLAFTRAGEHGMLWYAVAGVGLALDPARRERYLRLVRTTVLAYLANIALKYVVRRPRPVLDGLPPLSPTVTSLSYPSAHSTTSFAAARVLGGATAYTCASAMALSRLYVGVHYPSDVLAGAAFGSAIAELGR